MSQQEKGGAVKQEREFGYFSKSIPLPQDVKQDAIKASYGKNVLSITLPRIVATTEQEKQAVKINIE